MAICNMGVGCEEAGVCYAKAVGCPEQCGHPDGMLLTADERLFKAAMDALEDCRDTVWNEYHADWRNGLQPERSSVADLRRRAQEHDAVIAELRKRLDQNNLLGAKHG